MALLVAEHRLVLPLVLALPALPILVADRFRRQADAGGGINSMQLSAVALDLRASTSMLQGLLRSISREAERRGLDWLRSLAGNGVEHTKLLSGKLDQLQQSGAPLRGASARQHIDATDLVRVAEQLAKTICEGRLVVTDVASERLPVYVNQDEVLDVLGNLVLNAHRFAPPMTPVRLTVSREGAGVVLAVEDDGVDFKPEQRERIFEEELQREQAGGGISHGLAMARQLAHANGGELRAVDPGQADGRARFELSLPLAPEEPAEAGARAPAPNAIPSRCDLKGRQGMSTDRRVGRDLYHRRRRPCRPWVDRRPRSDTRDSTDVARILSGVQPTGNTHLGNYVGAFRQWVEQQHEFDAYYCVVDLHAITLPYDPAELRDRTLEIAAILLACGLDPDVCTLFVQSHVPEHTELAWLLNHIATVGELRRMTQFKARAAEGGEGALPAGYFNYPVLQAADILIYQADRVPVGEDQRQHLELTRDVAERFNARFGPTFTVPQAYIPKVGGRVMDLQRPDQKMSKSIPSPTGRIDVLDPPEAIRKKVRSAVTDSGREVIARPDKPAISNLLELYSVAAGKAVGELEEAYLGRGYGDLKADLAEALVAFLEPVRERYYQLRADGERLAGILETGAAKAQAVARENLALAKDRMGLLPRCTG